MYKNGINDKVLYIIENAIVHFSLFDIRYLITDIGLLI